MVEQKNLKIWNKPRLIKVQRPASLLELFFDIVVVALIGGIAHKLIFDVQNHSVGWVSMSFIILQTLSTLLVWRALTMYSIKFEVRDLRHRLVIFSCMFPMVLMASTGYAKGEVPDVYLVYLNLCSYGALMVSVSWIFISAAMSNKDDNFFFWYLMIKGITRTISFLLITISLIIPIAIDGTSNIVEDKWTKLITILWAVEFLIQLLGDLFSSMRRYTSHFPNISRHLLKERFSILYIAFLGEIIIQIISSFAHHHDTESFVYLFASILQVFLMFWIYFDLLNYNDLKKSYKWIWIYSFIMLLMFFSMLFISCGLSLAIKGFNEESVLLLLVGNLLYAGTSKIVLFSFNTFNKNKRYLEDSLFRIVVLVLWIAGLLVVISFTLVFKQEEIMIWGIITLEITTIILTSVAMIKSKKKYLHMTIKEFEAQLPKTKNDW
ncbi:low temperature requirement protein A [Mycoplasma marinum]|uniref:Low temperature requirement protein A n=1 Tax=Mycoplasma marinum TaxID=1937190 RepID=A0A4R0XK46_9MOLU|nr:low temperature requirement protein A [Mycoplasma marinum]TCG10824.1 hypothetical protein C4B24_03790 [Mycoplasma marinum]